MVNDQTTNVMKKIFIIHYSLFLALVASAQSPFISRVWEYCPAPGQFVNELPAYELGDDANTMRLKAEEAIANDQRGMITLGGWGGYVLFGFDHMVPNIADQNDFIVLGNAFYSASGEEEEGRRGGSCEPGIVLVSYDANGNGQPDDAWYELAGSEYANKSTIHDYAVTYYRPDISHEATPSQVTPALIDTTYIRWQDNHSAMGYLSQLSFHTQPYFPEWIELDSMTFTGARLPDNYRDLSGNGTNYVLYSYPWGYADNHPNTDQRAELDIDWAVCDGGTPASLPGIHFVKVYTAVHQQCGWIGETSTEIMGAIDLHCHTAVNNALSEPTEKAIYTITGVRVSEPLPHSVYILREGNRVELKIQK